MCALPPADDSISLLAAPSGHPQATLRPSGSQPVGTLKPPSGYPEATLRLPRGSGAGREEPRAGGPPWSGNSTNQSAKAQAITTNSNSSPVHEIARHVTISGNRHSPAPPEPQPARCQNN